MRPLAKLIILRAAVVAGLWEQDIEVRIKSSTEEDVGKSKREGVSYKGWLMEPQKDVDGAQNKFYSLVIQKLLFQSYQTGLEPDLSFCLETLFSEG